MLPKIEQPIFELFIPSIGTKKIRFRPMLVKEEKILLMAKEGQNTNDILLAIKQVVNNCIVDKNFNINDITIFDLEFLFIRIRALSVDSTIEVQYEDSADKVVRTFAIDLEKIDVKWPEKNEKEIKLSKNSGLVLKYPTIDLYENEDFKESDNEIEIFDELLYNSIDYYFIDDKIVKFKDFKKEEKKEFIDNLSIKAYNKIEEFLKNLPSVYHKIEYTNNNGDLRTITLESLNDFFTFV